MMSTSSEATPPQKKCAECAEPYDAHPLASIFGYDNSTYCEKCYKKLTKCAFCNVRTKENDLNEYKGTHYCDGCYGAMSTCGHCDAHLHRRRSRYYEWCEHTVCQHCAQDGSAYECNNCGRNVSIAEYCDNEMESWIENSLCYPCYEQKSESTHISDCLDAYSINTPLLEHYRTNPYAATGKAAMSKAAEWKKLTNFFNDFYYWAREEGFEHNLSYLRKGAFGYGDWGWHNSSAKVTVKVCDDIERFIIRLLKSEYLVKHKIHGQVQPFAELFASVMVFQITNKDYEGERSVMWRYPYYTSDKERANKEGIILYRGSDKELSTYVDYVDRKKLKQIILNRKFPDGSALIKKLNRVIVRNSEYVWGEFGSFSNNWSEYMTNAGSARCGVSIGFDASVHSKVVAWNGEIGSCQSEEYREGLGFNHISMSVNPHLYLLFYHPVHKERIIGRSVVRFWYPRSSTSGKISKRKLFIMPSRLYLSDFTHMKFQFYAEMFKVLSEWAPLIAQKFGMNNEPVLAAYTRTRHDSHSVWDYLVKANDDKLKLSNRATRPRIASEWYHPIWNSLPSGGEGYWAYYPDEHQQSELATSKENQVNEFVVRETMCSDIRVIKVIE